MNPRLLITLIFSRLNWKWRIAALVVCALVVLYQDGFDFRSDEQSKSVAPVEFVYTRHAKCRMDCRNISQRMVEEVWQEGSVNKRKSDRDSRPCPTMAKEDNLDNRKLRIVYALCPNETKVVTAIDLKNKFNCECS